MIGVSTAQTSPSQAKQPRSIPAARNTGRSSNSQSQSAKQATPIEPYLQVPDRLLRQFAHDPLAVGVYLVVARLVQANRSAVPLSPADLAEWSTGKRVRDLAIMRRIQRLITTGWLIKQGGHTVKPLLQPTWEPRLPEGNVCLWNMQLPQAGKPETVRVRRLPMALLDRYIGRIDPQPGRVPAVLTRYLPKPLLDLVDLGVYAIALVTQVAPTPTLRRLNLLDTSGPQLPAGLAELVALSNPVLPPADPIVQREMGEIKGDGTDCQPIILPITDEIFAQSGSLNGSLNGSPNGSVSGSLNGSPNGSDQGDSLSKVFTAPGASKTIIQTKTAANTWDSWDSWKNHGSPTLMDHDQHGGGGGVIHAVDLLNEPSDHAAREVIIQQLGIRHRLGLRTTSLTCLQAWQHVISHPGLIAQFRDPIAFAYSQLRIDNFPPDMAELNRWANRTAWGTAPESSPWVVSPDLEANNAAWHAQAQELSGSDDGDLICCIVAELSEGQPPDVALEQGYAAYRRIFQRDGEEVDHAIRHCATC